jgi:hypothetical protein
MMVTLSLLPSVADTIEGSARIITTGNHIRW